ncbi:hypothetical protein [Tuberibacillus sp. Marseille-P3662]|uniref:hypothetical protein n=1 Tax=Tuberibacillus sp. Marseille-P3662 TaxID=1965358 RepID=UPI000A1CEC04|nr:hypothetical protein [Tuberibacillus sp. Marseille-P3662]
MTQSHEDFDTFSTFQRRGKVKTIIFATIVIMVLVIAVAGLVLMNFTPQPESIQVLKEQSLGGAALGSSAMI